MEEKRKFIRADICTEVDYQILPIQADFFKGNSRNISKKGICFLAREEMKIGTLLLLKFHLPDKEKTYIECIGKVIWQKKADGGFFIGVEFRDLDASKELKIAMFILQYLREIKEYK